MTINRRTLNLSALSLAVSLAAPARAASQAPFDQVRFDAARASNAPVLVFVAADWCPTCRAQGPVIAQLATDPAFARLQIFKLDYDSQKALRRALRATRQSTLIAFKNGVEVGRSVGATNPAQIRALMQLTIS